jgi:hypothetical protein
MASGYAGRVVYGESQALDTQRLQSEIFSSILPVANTRSPRRLSSVERAWPILPGLGNKHAVLLLGT